MNTNQDDSLGLRRANRTQTKGRDLLDSEVG